MLCEKCKKNTSTFFYKVNINGKEKSYSLCQECADKMKKSGELGDSGFLNIPFFSHQLTPSIFSGLFSVPEKDGNTAAGHKKCNLCGITFSELLSEGKVGCPKCYETFSDELEHTITSIHGSTSHTGRAPRGMREEMDTKRKIKELEEQLNELIKNEEYEKAAEIRDELRRIRGESK